MKKYLLLVAAVAALVSCTSDFIQPEAPEQEIPEQGQDAPEVENLQEVLIYANAPKSGSDQSEESSSQEQELPETRTQLVNGTDVRWSAEDVVKVCFPAYQGWTSYKRWYEVTALFTSVGADGDEKMVFKGNWNTSAECGSSGVIFYPQSVEYSSKYSTYTSDYGLSNTIAYTIPDVQTAVDNSFAPNLNLSYAFVTKTAMDNNEVSVSFKNLCGLVKVKLPEEDYDIVSITLESTNTGAGGNLCGKANLSIDSSNEWDYSYPTAAQIITLQREDGSELTPGASYYAVVWPRSHSSIRFTFTDVNGNEAVKESPADSNHDFAAGTITSFNISSLNFDVAPYLNVSTNSITPKARGSYESFFVTANNAWSTSKTDSPWLTLVEDQEANTVELTATENTTPYERTATITVTSADRSETITVTQPPVYYTIGSVALGARALEDQAMYVVFFGGSTQGTGNKEQTYCWTTDLEGDVAMTSLTDKSQKVTANYVFKFHKTQSFTNNWMTDGQSYNNASSGYLQSMYNGKYQSANVASSMLDFIADDKASATELIFAGWWQGDAEYGADLDIWDYATRSSGKKTMYWTGSYLNYSTNTDVYPRKWFFYKVTEVE